MASGDAVPIPRKNVAYRVTFPLLDADGDLVTGASGLDSEVSKDGGAFADCTNEATEIGSSGIYTLDLTNTEMNADTVAVIVKSSSAKTTPLVLYPEELGDIRVDVGQISGDATAADNLEAGFDGTGYAGGTIKQVVDVGAISGDTAAADNLESEYDGNGFKSYVRRNTAQAGAAGTITLDASASATDDLYNGLLVAILSGTGAGQARLITDYTGSSKVAAIAPNWTTNPSSDSVFVLVPWGRVDLALWLGSAPNALSSGRVDSTVGAMQADTVTASAIATDAIGSNELAQAAADKVWSSATRSLTDKAGFALSSAGIQAIWDAATSALTTAGSIGKLIVDNLNATISSRATQASLDTVDDFLDTEIAAIKAKTDNLPASPAATGDIPTAGQNADAVWDEATSGHVTAGTFGQRLAIIRAGTAQAGAAGTLTLDASASAVDDFYNNTLLVLTGGTGANQARFVTDYNGTTKVATVSPNWTTTPDNTSVFVLIPFASLPGASAPTAAEVADAVWAEALPGSYGSGEAGKLVGDNLNATVGSRATQVSVDAVDDFLDTEVAAIKAQTDLLSFTGNDVKATLDGETVTVGTNNDKTGYSLSAAGIQGIWDRLTSALTTAGSIGKLLVDQLDATISSRLASSSYTAPSNATIAAIEVDTQDIQSRLPAALVSGRMDSSVGAMAANTLNASALAADAVDEILDEQIGDGTLTMRQALRVLVAGMSGKLSGAATTTVTIRNVNDSADVIVATVDADGNRSAVTVTP